METLALDKLLDELLVLQSGACSTNKGISGLFTEPTRLKAKELLRAVQNQSERNLGLEVIANVS